MNKIYLTTITAILFLIAPSITWSQKIDGVRTAVVTADSLWITVNKTTSLIFPYGIKSVDRGSADVLAQKAKGAQNVLLVKAAKEAFAETNLSVITTDGRFYSFLLNYRKNPAALTLSFFNDTTLQAPGIAAIVENSEALLQAFSKKVSGEKPMFFGKGKSKDKMRLQLNGIYINTDVLFFQFEVRNDAYINYDMDGLRFFIRDKKKQKRTSSQEIEILPLYVQGDTVAVKARSKNIVVTALPKFTLADKKYLHIELGEKGGGRNLSLKVHNRTLVRAKNLD